MNEEEQLSVLRSVVVEVCPEAPEVLGPRVTEALIRGKTKFQSPLGYDNIDHTAIANGVLLVINFAAAVLKLREELLKRRKESGSEKDGLDRDRKGFAHLRSDTTVTVEQQDQIISIIMRSKSG